MMNKNVNNIFGLLTRGLNLASCGSILLHQNVVTLAGKPKLFFIQACRGEKTDKGIQLRGILSYTDGPESKGNTSDIEEDYSVASYSDFLKATSLLNRNNNGIRGSVFIHYLAKVLEEDGKKDELGDSSTEGETKSHYRADCQYRNNHK
ncbi:Caspase-1 [Armadillidium vulgare]|nr:Caspase-1 [Armadillidium vulgare]